MRRANRRSQVLGRDFYGEVGDGTDVYRLTPVAVSGLSSAATISTGGRQTCAVTSTGGAKCWGLNTRGQVGNGNVRSDAGCDCYRTPQDVVVSMSKATPTPTATPTPCPLCPVEFHLSVDTEPTLGGSCDTKDGPITCSAPLGDVLHAKVYLGALGSATAYQANGVTMTFTGIDAKYNADAVWPGCVGEAASPPSPGFVKVRCASTTTTVPEVRHHAFQGILSSDLTRIGRT